MYTIFTTNERFTALPAKFVQSSDNKLLKSTGKTHAYPSEVTSVKNCDNTINVSQHQLFQSSARTLSNAPFPHLSSGDIVY